MMFYRRKVLLALIETFGGKLKRTDCQKLLFLFCQYAGQNFYDFFPYHYGGFSFVASQDKGRLETEGLLTQSEHFERTSGDSFVDQLKKRDQALLKSFASDIKDLRGKALIRKTYLEHPLYACRSTILSHVLSPQEIASLKPWWCIDTSPRLFTIGYEGKSIDAYLRHLIANHVKALVDVRKNPFSMKYEFSKSLLQMYVERAGLLYFHLPDLGVPSSLRKKLDTPEAYRNLFRYYRTSILPAETESIKALKALLKAIQFS